MIRLGCRHFVFEGSGDRRYLAPASNGPIHADESCWSRWADIMIDVLPALKRVSQKSPLPYKIFPRIKDQDTTMSSTRKLRSPDDAQYELFGGVPASVAEPLLQTAIDSGRRFVTGDPRAIFLGTIRLEEHLKRSGQCAPLIVGRLLGEQDWQAFERRYAATGRAPYAPQSMVGLGL